MSLAQRIPEAVIENVRSQANILDVVGQFVQLQRSGKEWFGLCPFHSEKTPSFSVNEQKQFFHCFSCNRGGNVFSFLMELEDLSFPEAVYRVAELENIDIDQQYSPQNTASTEQENSENGQLKHLYQTAAELYHYILMQTKIGQPALDYLHQRGLDDALIDEFNLGFAPEQKILAEYFSSHQLGDYQLHRKSGLFIEKNDGTLTDRFFNRVMFPLRNASGQTIAFSGRALVRDERTPKYLNSPETVLFNKGRLLFNFDKAKRLIRKSGQVFLFEGFMDVLAAYQAGITNGIASMGTSLTDEQIYLLRPIAKEVLICYDGDDPGQEATKRAITLLNEAGHFTVKTVALPEKLDPDEFVRKYGAQAFQKNCQENQITVLEFYLEYFKKGRNLQTESGQLAYITDVLSQAAEVDDDLQVELTLTKLAREFALDKASLASQLRVLKQEAGSQRAKAHLESPLVKVTNAEHYSKVELAQRTLIHYLLNEPNAYLYVANLPSFQFENVDYQALYLLIQGYFSKYQTYIGGQFLDYLGDENLKKLVVSIEMEDYGAYSEEELKDCIYVIDNEAPLDTRLASVKRELEQAKRQNEPTKIMELTTQYIELVKLKQTVADDNR